MESDGGNLQNEFFNKARREHTVVTVFLANGKKLVGRIKAFDKFTILLDPGAGGPGGGEQMIFKHAISTVSTARAGEDELAEPRRMMR
jgi:host factor-I protein